MELQTAQAPKDAQIMKAVLVALLIVCLPSQLQTEFDEVVAIANLAIEDNGAPLDLELRAEDYEGVDIPFVEQLPAPPKYQDI